MAQDVGADSQQIPPRAPRADRSRSADPGREHGACGLGFVASRTGRPDPTILRDALSVLVRLDHRGAVGADPATGDGCGVLLDVPDALLRDELTVDLPPAGAYALAQLFVPRGADTPELRARIEHLARCQSLEPLAWREVPVDPTACGPLGNARRPDVRQLILGVPDQDQATVARTCWALRRELDLSTTVYSCSVSTRTVVYKGLLIPERLPAFYADLRDPRVSTRFAIVHQRFSTNTTPAWARAQPLRLLAHNGEINTLKGNQRWMLAREAELQYGDFGQDPHLLRPILDTRASDSAQLDEAVDLLVQTGRPLEQALAALVPPAWRFGERSPALRAFHAFHESMFEPWDGPAGLAFGDGAVVGARLDRNGLRPLRFAVADDRIVCASEAGALPLPEERIERRGRLGPGQSLLVRLDDGELLDGEALEARIVGPTPWWQRRQAVVHPLASLPDPEPPALHEAIPGQPAEDYDADTLRRLFGWTDEDVERVVDPMAAKGKEAVGSMGDDTPPAILSRKPQALFRYFRQLFAQVTNPPIDSLRERSAMDLTVLAGARPRFVDGEGGALIELPHPVLRASEFRRLGGAEAVGVAVATLSMHWDGVSLAAGVDRLCRAATEALREGAVLLVLSDRGAAPNRLPMPSLLGVAAVHQHLVSRGLRTRCDLVVDTGEARDVTDFCLLLGYGASAVHPWLTLQTVAARTPDGVSAYLDAIHKGVLKVMSKMGIASFAGYRGAQIFEALGLDDGFVRRYFRGTSSRLGGLDLEGVADEYRRRFDAALAPQTPGVPLPIAGRRRWRKGGEAHAWGPHTLGLLQHACRSGRYELYERFAARIDGQHEAGHSFRGLLRPRSAPIPVESVESVESLVRRFRTGAMSYGSLGREAHEALALAMNRLGGASNSGEGGEDPGRATPDAEGSRRSSIKQVASGRFGMTTTYLVSADELQIKIAQGAKPGEGGHLPGTKVDSVIAELRCSTPGVGLISPPPHHDIYSIEDLAQLIHDLRRVNPTAAISVKLVSQVGVGTVAAGVAKAGADRILIAGAGGGTGAAPLTSIHHAGLPWELGLAETHQALVRHGLRDAVTLEVDGQLRTGRDVFLGALLGADSFGFATAALVAMGCVMMRACHLNTCPVGIATQNPALRARFAGHPDHVVNFFVFLAEHLRRQLAAAGLRSLDEAIGRTDLLDVAALDHPKAHTLDLGPLLHAAATAEPLTRVELPTTPPVAALSLLEHRLDRHADPSLLPVKVFARISNTDRSIGTRLAGQLQRAGVTAPGAAALELHGSAGQSLGAFATPPIHIHLHGEANDYVGKGLCGGRIVLVPPKAGRTDVLLGNVALYGATAGELFAAGGAGERFAVRNSGAVAVVEGLGDHGCEYMTGGRVLVLGPTGANFAAGMSGGVAWVLDEDGRFAERCNPETVDLEPLDDAAADEVHALLERHRKLTGSRTAWRIRAEWGRYRRRFVQVMPREYRRALEELEVRRG